MKVTFVSNYINHHQIPFCNAMEEKCDFTFIQTQPMEQERIAMGWGKDGQVPYLMESYSSPEAHEAALSLISDSDVVIFGGCEDESYIQPRLQEGKLVIRYSERMYRSGQWKCITPRGLIRKYKDHTRYRKGPAYLLCSGGYVASDFHIFRSYPKKMFCWGYFPAVKTYDIDRLMEQKGYVINQAGDKVPYLLWAGRFLALKHPELALNTARYLKDKGIDFRLEMIGGGVLEEEIKRRAEELGLSDKVLFPGFVSPEEVRKRMEKAHIFMFTSDRNEGWGAVVNESMNSGCAVICNHMIGSVPFLIENGVNGCIYPNRDHSLLMRWAEELIQDKELREEIGRNAYYTIRQAWNPEFAADRLYELIERLMKEWDIAVGAKGVPGSLASSGTEKDSSNAGTDKRKAEDLASAGAIPASWNLPSFMEHMPYPCKPERPRSERRIEDDLMHYQ